MGFSTQLAAVRDELAVDCELAYFEDAALPVFRAAFPFAREDKALVAVLDQKIQDALLQAAVIAFGFPLALGTVTELVSIRRNYYGERRGICEVEYSPLGLGEVSGPLGLGAFAAVAGLVGLLLELAVARLRRPRPAHRGSVASSTALLADRPRAARRPRTEHSFSVP